MKSIGLTILILGVLNLQESKAQLKKTLDDIAATTGNIKSIFQKKKVDNQDSSKVGKAVNEETPSDAKNKKNLSYLKAGDVAPNAKYLDVDVMFPFSLGAALVAKGGSTALIDSNGSFIVPFNKYQIEGKMVAGIVNEKYQHGMFEAVEISTGKKGVLNSNGKFIALQNGFWDAGDEIIQTSVERPYIYFDLNLNKYTMDKSLSDFREGVGVSYNDPLRKPGTKVGYKTLTGQFLVRPQYDFAKPFYEGRAIVGKFNEFGEVKWGFIDKTGKEIFPCVLSQEPSHFSSGRARIEPKDKSEFDYAYINLDGKIAIKCKDSDGPSFGDFTQGYSFSMFRVMDSTGKSMSRENFLKKFGLNNQYNGGEPNPYLRNSDFMTEKFTFGAIGNNSSFDVIEGFIDVKTGKAVKPAFVSDHYRLRFDRIARRALVKTLIGRDKEHQTDIYREGYINEDGLYVIVKGSGSKW